MSTTADRKKMPSAQRSRHATLLATINAVGAQPELAQFRFRAMNRWQQGTHSRTRIQSFYGAGGEQMHEREFTYDADHPWCWWVGTRLPRRWSFCCMHLRRVSPQASGTSRRRVV